MSAGELRNYSKKIKDRSILFLVIGIGTLWMFFGIAFIIVGIYEFRKSKLCLKLAEERGGGVSVPRVEEGASDFAKKKHITSKRGDGMRFSVIDIETVNDSPTGIATIGCVGVDNGTIVKTKEYYIKPEPFVFEENAIAVNGLREADFVNCPTFSEIWEDLRNFISDYDFCVAHNAIFDFGIIKYCCQKYHLQYDDFTVVDTLAYSRNIFPDLPSHKLDSLCENFKIKLRDHHNALCDATATAKLLSVFIKTENATILDVLENGNALNFSDFKARNHVGIRNNKKENYNPNWTLHAKDVEAADVSFQSDNPFNEKNVVISGNLSAMDRKSAYSLLKACGAVPCDSVTMKTDYLITNSEVETGKIKKAREYIARGIKIEIIDEGKFVKILEDSYGAD